MLSRVAELSTLPYLCYSLREDHDPLTRYWSAIAIGNIDTRTGCAALREAARSETHPFVKEGIQTALERGCRDGAA
jgi:HEAT repeat protein